jgi:hypothetical protein
MNENLVGKMVIGLKKLSKLRGAKGYAAIDGVFDNAVTEYGEATYEEKTSVLYRIMGISAGAGSNDASAKEIYELAKDLLVSGDWEEFVD